MKKQASKKLFSGFQKKIELEKERSNNEEIYAIYFVKITHDNETRRERLCGDCFSGVNDNLARKAFESWKKENEYEESEDYKAILIKELYFKSITVIA